MPDLIKISHGTVYDPANGIDGQVRDLWIAGDKIVAAPLDRSIRPTREIDAQGKTLGQAILEMKLGLSEKDLTRCQPPRGKKP